MAQQEMFEVKGNTAVATIVQRERPKLEDITYDESMWERERYIENQWDCSMSGKDDTVIVATNYQLKVWFKRKLESVLTVPPLAEVHVHVKRGRKTKRGNHLKSCVIIPDIHVGFRREGKKLIPFHDNKALAVAYEILREVKPDRVVILGDLLDFAEWSDKFARPPELRFLTQEALNEAGRILGKIRAMCPDAKIDLLEGNHSVRLQNLLIKQLSEAYGIKPVDAEFPALSMQNLLNLKELNISYIGNYPNGKLWLNENLACVHGSLARPKSGQTASAMLESSTHSVIFGHIHRNESCTVTRWKHRGPRSYTAYSPGCLCRIDGVVPGVKAEQNWQQGVGIVYFQNRGNGFFQIVHCPIYDGQTIFNGKLIKA